MDTILTLFNNMKIMRMRTRSSAEHIKMDTITLYSNCSSGNSSLSSSPSLVRKKPLELMNLPAEIQTKMLLCLPVESLKMARLVCSSWCDLIDSSREFSLIIDDRKYDYADCQFPPWKITSCLIKYFHQHKSTNFLIDPAALHKLSIWGTISKPNFQLLMSQVCNIEELDLACDFFTSHKYFFTTLDGSPLKLKLEQLRKLTMFSNFNIVHHHDNLFGIFDQSMPNLAKLKITMSDPVYNRNALVISPDEVKIAIGLAKFIAGHKNLKFLQISISPNVFSDEHWVAEAVRRVHQESPNYEANLSQINLQICRLNVSPLYVILLRPLLMAQSGLKDLRIQSQFMEGVNIQYPSLENSVRCSIHTLGSLHLEWISKFPVHPMTVINFELFSQAQQLRRLVLKRWWGFTLGTNGMAKITNLNKIPSSIEHLAIEGFLCSHEEVKMVAESPSFNNLTEIRLIHVGLYGDGVGINGAVTKAFCLKESLNNLSLGPLRNQSPDREDPEFQELRERFKDDNFCGGKIVNFDFVQFQKRQELQRRKDAQAEERRSMLCSCFHVK